ncbi:MAG: type II toxin-antitoxin system ParD family antitoxin, partial [Pseudomonadota bacterium]
SVATGKYASGSEVIRAGLRTLQERDVIIEDWLKEQVSGTYDAIMRGEQPTHDVGAVFDRLRTAHCAQAIA